jgi:uncharacterized membrane protein HdeD (DUF308 family)
MATTLTASRRRANRARMSPRTPACAIAGARAGGDAAAMSEQADPFRELRGAGWLLIGAGAISVIAGVLAVVYPDITLLALALFAGINLIVLGSLSLVDAFAADQDGGARALSAILGVLGLIGGLVILRRPGQTLLALVLVLGIWLVVWGVIHLFRALAQTEGRGLGLLGAACEIVLGALILSLPDVSLRTVAILAGISFIVRGGLSVYAGLQLRRAGAHGSRLAPAA